MKKDKVYVIFITILFLLVVFFKEEIRLIIRENLQAQWHQQMKE